MKRILIVLIAAVATLALAACEEAATPTAPAAAAPPATSAPDPAPAAKVIELRIAADGADQRVEQTVGGNTSNLVVHTLAFPSDFSAGVPLGNAGKEGYLDQWFRFTSTVQLAALTNEELERQSGISIDGTGRTWHLLAVEPMPDFHISVTGTLGGAPGSKPAPSAAARLEVALSQDVVDSIYYEGPQTLTAPAASTLIKKHLTHNSVKIRLALR